jgi:hypothetical protein
MDEPLNPYASPEPYIAESQSVDEQRARHTANPWKEIARRWERLRIWYNAILHLCGISGFLNDPLYFLQGAEFALAYAIMANLCYLSGPIAEMYLNWFVDRWEQRLPGFVVRVGRSTTLTIMLFTLGTLGSALLTLAISWASAFALTLPDQN